MLAEKHRGKGMFGRMRERARPDEDMRGNGVNVGVG